MILIIMVCNIIVSRLLIEIKKKRKKQNDNERDDR